MGKTKDFTRQLVTKMLSFAAMAVAAILLFSVLSLQAEAANAKVTASSARVRKQASTTSDVVGSVANGESFAIQEEVTGTDGYTWYKIDLNGTAGYIRSDLAQKTESSSTGSVATNTEVTAIQPVSAKVIGEQVRVRPDASTNGSVVTTVAKDTVVTVTGTAVGADSKTWYSVSFRSGNQDMSGFIREDFLQLAGNIVPETEQETEVPPVEEPVVEIPEVKVEVKDYDTFKKDDVWYLVNNTSSPAYQYVIDDIFNAAEKNASLYEGSLKTIRNQKIFIVILVLLLVAGGIGATLVIFKMKDMLDESYFEEVEKEVSAKRQNKQQNVMHTVGKDSAQKRPTVNGQQRPAPKQQPAAGKTQVAAKPQPTAGTQAAAKTQTETKPQPAAEQLKQPPKPGQVPVAAPQKDVSKSQINPAQKPANVPNSVNEQKPKTEFKSKNFMSDDEDDFEYDFLNWDGEEEI